MLLYYIRFTVLGLDIRVCIYPHPFDLSYKNRFKIDIKCVNGIENEVNTITDQETDQGEQTESQSELSMHE